MRWSGSTGNYRRRNEPTVRRIQQQDWRRTQPGGIMEKKHINISREGLMYLLNYDSTAGVFTWKSNRTPSVKKGDVAGTIDNEGYRKISIGGRGYRAARLAWLYFYGNEPTYYIDHINGIKLDNRISNLRDVPLKINNQNMPTHRSGHLLGTHFDPRRQKNPWQAITKINGKLTHIGMFSTQELAHEAYLQAIRRVECL